jgi:hypothetical protein
MDKPRAIMKNFFMMQVYCIVIQRLDVVLAKFQEKSQAKSGVSESLAANLEDLYF